MREIKIKNTTLWIIVLLTFALFTPLAVFRERQEIFEIVDALAVGMGIGVLLGYAKTVWRAIKLPVHDLTSGDYMLVGLYFSTMGSSLRLAGQWYWRANDKPNWWIDSLGLFYITIFIVIGVAFFLLTTASHEGVLVKNAVYRPVALGSVSIFIASCMIWYGWG